MEVCFRIYKWKFYITSSKTIAFTSNLIVYSAFLKYISNCFYLHNVVRRICVVFDSILLPLTFRNLSEPNLILYSLIFAPATATLFYDTLCEKMFYCQNKIFPQTLLIGFPVCRSTLFFHSFSLLLYPFFNHCSSIAHPLLIHCSSIVRPLFILFFILFSVLLPSVFLLFHLLFLLFSLFLFLLPFYFSFFRFSSYSHSQTMSPSSSITKLGNMLSFNKSICLLLLMFFCSAAFHRYLFWVNSLDFHLFPAGFKHSSSN